MIACDSFNPDRAMDLQAILKYDPAQPRDRKGRWAGTGFGMVSPNVLEGLDLASADRALHEERHAKLRAAFDEIDQIIGMRASTNSGIGAWADGAENSTVTKYTGSDYEEVRAAVAMKGWIADQKAVIAFQQNSKGKHAMFDTRVPGTVAEVHKDLLDSGVEFHTLVEDGDGVKVFAFDQSGGLTQKFIDFARKHGQKAKVTFGEGDFIGSWDSRDEGRAAYEGEIEGFLGRWDPRGELRERWGRIRDHWSEASRAQGLRKGEKSPLYVSRKVLNADELIAWAKAQGFKTMVPPEELHVAAAYSRAPVDWDAAGDHFDYLKVEGGERSVAPLGDKGALVLKFRSGELQARWKQFREAGASWDYESYQPHVTLTYNNPDKLDPASITPFDGVLEFGPEVMEPLDLDWSDKLVEKLESALKFTHGLARKFNPYRDSKGRYSTGPGASMEEDMDLQSQWLDEKARQFGYAGADEFMEKSPEAFMGLASIWRETHTIKWEDIARILKFNPFHDEKGRFTTGPKATFVSIGDKFQTTLEGKRRRYREAQEDAAAQRTLDKVADLLWPGPKATPPEVPLAKPKDPGIDPKTGQKTLGLPGQEAADIAAHAARAAEQRETTDREAAKKYVESMRRITVDGMGVGTQESDADVLYTAWKTHVPNVGLHEFVSTMLGGETHLSKVNLTVSAEGIRIRQLGGDVYGAPVELYERSFDFAKKDVHHDYLKIMEGGRGGGAVKEMFRNCIPMYKKMGMQTVSVCANLDAGGYAWARFGFRAESEMAARMLRDSVQRQVESRTWGANLPEEAREEWRAMNRVLAQAGSSLSMPQIVTGLKTPQLDKALESSIQSMMHDVPSNVPRTLIRGVLQQTSWNGKLNLYSNDDMNLLQAYVGKFKEI